MAFQPLNAVDLLLQEHPDHGTLFLGTCFAFRTPSHYLTAGHCVEGLAPPDL
jgi:hypothetical protein